VVPQGLHPAWTRQQGQVIGNQGSSWCEGIEKKQRRGGRWVGVVVVGLPQEGGCGPGCVLGEVDWTVEGPLRQCVRLPKRDLTSWEEKWNKRDEGAQSRQSCPR
jgi:hypothetical protein